MLIVVVLGLELFLPYSRSLKDKRSVIKSLFERAKSRNNLSIIEADYNDLWQRSRVIISSIASDTGSCDRFIEEMRSFFSSKEGVVVTNFMTHLYQIGE
jgi:uncharacterized protein YlxP (DUF503 family)